jgi:hypothetical protein
MKICEHVLCGGETRRNRSILQCLSDAPSDYQNGNGHIKEGFPLLLYLETRDDAGMGISHNASKWINVREYLFHSTSLFENDSVGS